MQLTSTVTDNKMLILDTFILNDSIPQAHLPGVVFRLVLRVADITLVSLSFFHVISPFSCMFCFFVSRSYNLIFLIHHLYINLSCTISYVDDCLQDNTNVYKITKCLQDNTTVYKIIQMSTR